MIEDDTYLGESLKQVGADVRVDARSKLVVTTLSPARQSSPRDNQAMPSAAEGIKAIRCAGASQSCPIRSRQRSPVA